MFDAHKHRERIAAVSKPMQPPPRTLAHPCVARAPKIGSRGWHNRVCSGSRVGHQ